MSPEKDFKQLNRQPSSERHHPDCLFLDDNTVIPWDETTPEQRQDYFDSQLQASANGHQNGNPDRGNGKASRKKSRRANGWH